MSASAARVELNNLIKTSKKAKLLLKFLRKMPKTKRVQTMRRRTKPKQLFTSPHFSTDQEKKIKAQFFLT